MKSKQLEAIELESELLRLNTLVRARRAQLERLERCPNKDCECRLVWKEHVAKNLASQMTKIRNQVKPKTTNGSKTRKPVRATR